MPPTMTITETFLSLFLTCSLKGTMFLLLAGMMALLSSSASQRHFTWICGFLCLGALLVLEPLVPHWEILPNWQALGWVQNLSPWILPVWGAGVLLFCGKVLFGLFALVHIERTSASLTQDPWETMLDECRHRLGVRRPIRLLQFPGRIMPMTWGVLRQFIVLPSSAVRWSNQRARAVLMHELAHVRRRDYLASLLRDAVCAFYWFHPLIWWAAREMDEDREQASDDAVIAAGHRPISYAEHLATVATRGRGRIVNPQIRPKIALAERPLLVRIRAILTPWKSRHPITWQQRLQTATLLALLLAAVLIAGPRGSMGDDSGRSMATRVPATRAPLSYHPSPALPRTGIGTSLPAGAFQAVRGWRPLAHSWEFTSGEPAARAVGGFPGIAAFPAQETGAEDSQVFFYADPNIRPRGRTSNTSSGGRSDGGIYLPPAEYSTSPPEETAEGPEAIDIGEVMASFENVGHIGVDDFDLGQISGEAAQGKGNKVFDSGEFGLGEGTFSAASLTMVKEVGNLKDQPIEKNVPALSTAKSRGSAEASQRLTAVRPPVPLPTVPAAAQNRPDPGLDTWVSMVKSRSTGKSHLAITFRRKASAPTASFRFEASPDLRAGSWDFNPDHFVFAGVRSQEGRHEATIVLSQPTTDSAFRFLRIRSTSAASEARAEPIQQLSLKNNL